MSTDSLSTDSLDSYAATAAQTATESVKIRCTGCGEESSSARRFCGKCGHLLWEPCLSCASNNPIDVKFCGKCGDDLTAGFENRRQELEQAIKEADEFAAAGRYLEGLKLLEELTLVDHSQLRELTTQIENRKKEFPDQRQEAIARSSKTTKEAKTLITESHFEIAHQQLAEIPEAFRTQEINEMLSLVETKLSEAQRLRKVVKQALSKRKFEGLLAQVDRLLELCPQDAKLEKIRGQLQLREQQKNLKVVNQLLKLAKAALAKSDYQAAEAALAKLPQSDEAGSETAKIISAIKERIWLANEMRTAPIVSPALKVIANRLAKLQPHDQQHAKMVQQLDARLQKAAKQKESSSVAWVKPPAENAFGLPISMLNLPAELASYGKIRSHEKHSLLIAFGLALQGLGRAEVSLYIAPKEKKKWLKRLSRKPKKIAAASAWGIDLGAQSLKAVQLAFDAKNQQIQVVQAMTLRHEIACAGSVQNSLAAESQTVLRFLKQHSLEGQVVVLNLPSTQTLGRFFDIPAPKPDKFFEAVAFELQARIPMKEERLYYDYHWSELPSTSKSSVPQRRVLLAAADRAAVQMRLQLFASAGISHLLMQSDGIALGNAARHIQPLSRDGGTRAILEVGAGNSNFVVTEESHFWFRGLYLGADLFDKAIATEFQKTKQDASLLRLQPEKIAALHEIDALLQPAFANIAEELQRTLRRYQDETGNSISQLSLCGGGAQQHGLLRFLQTP